VSIAALPMIVDCAVAPAGSSSARVGHTSTHSGTPPFSSAQKSHQPLSKYILGVRVCRMPSSTCTGAITPRGQAS
jgi:hypothetical protein